MFIHKIIFRYAYPLDEERRELWQNKNFGDYPNAETVRRKTEEWQKLWDEINQDDKIIKRIIELLGLTLPRDVEVYVFGNGLSPMSVPLLMPIIGFDGPRTDDNFIETLIHELTHNFISRKQASGYKDFLRTKYKDESIRTQNHILVYAVVETILTELFGEEKMRELIAVPDDYPDYKRAIEIVDTIGREELIKEFKNALEGSKTRS